MKKIAKKNHGKIVENINIVKKNITKLGKNYVKNCAKNHVKNCAEL